MSITQAHQGDIVLSCKGLHRYLGQGEGRVHVLKGVSFEARRGQVYAIVGPSGCGKSTLLYLLGLLDKPDQGEIYIDGKLMSNDEDSARTLARGQHIGFVFQFHFLMLEFTALENVMMPMRKLGKLTQDQMVARALANQPAIILADEPTGNLDVTNSGIVFDLLTRLAKENGQAVILVTHNPEIAARCDVRRPMRDGLFVE